MRPVGRPGRWAWGLCGLATAAALAVPGTRLIFSAGITPPAPARAITRQAPRWVTARILTRTVSVPQRVTSLNVRGYGSASGLRGLAARLQGFPPGLIQVTAAPVTHVRVTETIVYDGRPPVVTPSVSDGRLFLADPACANEICSVSFAVQVPPGVAVTAAGGPMYISGTSGANLDSAGLPVSVTNIHGPLTVSTDGGPLQINGLSGPLHADTGGGQIVATRVTAATAVVTTGGGSAQLTFSAAPTSVTVRTGGGLAELAVPPGPYALTANSDGALQTIGIVTSSVAHRSITVTTGGGPLVIGPWPARCMAAVCVGPGHGRGIQRRSNFISPDQVPLSRNNAALPSALRALSAKLGTAAGLLGGGHLSALRPGS
jgi:hypothetical protein